jgi:hypothetical protein
MYLSRGKMLCDLATKKSKENKKENKVKVQARSGKTPLSSLENCVVDSFSEDSSSSLSFPVSFQIIIL